MIDLTVPKAVHIVGVGGAGMSAIASVLAAMGHRVTGSDLKASPGLERLRAQGVEVVVGHAAENVGAVDAVAVSTAVPDRNPEVQTARDRAIPVLRRADILAAICSTRRTIAVSGTHGKTTTTSMLALALVEAGVRPSFIIGGEVNEIGGGAAWADGEWFVVEADESDGTFLDLPAEAVVVTSVEADHLDHYGSLDAIVAAFEQFLAGAERLCVVCADDPIAARLGAAAGAVTYGIAAGARYRIVDLGVRRTQTTFGVERDGQRVADVVLPVPGAHNARNATAALVTAVELGLPVDAAVRSLARYAGVARRFQFRGETRGITVVDDYAHNPGKIRAVIDAAKHGGWARVVCVFQPHRYSRTAALGLELGEALAPADVLVVTDVYGAGEPAVPGVTGLTVARAALDARPWGQVAYLPRRRDAVPYLASRLRPGDLCLTLGAGDVTLMADEILSSLGRAP